MTVQLDLFAARRNRDDAIRRVSDHAGTDWLDAAKAALVSVAKSHHEFIVDLLWDTGLARPSEARSMGAVMRWGVGQGIIAPTNRVVSSAQPQCHANKRTVWVSCVFDPGPALPFEDVR